MVLEHLPFLDFMNKSRAEGSPPGKPGSKHPRGELGKGEHKVETTEVVQVE